MRLQCIISCFYLKTCVKQELFALVGEADVCAVVHDWKHIAALQIIIPNSLWYLIPNFIYCFLIAGILERWTTVTWRALLHWSANTSHDDRTVAPRDKEPRNIVRCTHVDRHLLTWWLYIFLTLPTWQAPTFHRHEATENSTQCVSCIPGSEKEGYKQPAR